MSLVFPDKDQDFYKNLLNEHCVSIAKLAVDLLRYPYLSIEWMARHSKIVNQEVLDEKLREAKRQGKGAIFCSGHLHNFEFLPFCLAAAGHPVSSVVRSLKHKKLDDWWNSIRERGGSKMIPRQGAVKTMYKALKSGEGVGILFDQNITRNHAVFVDWFGRKAATTKTVAGLALKAKVPVFIIHFVSNDPNSYEMEFIECNFSDLYENSSLSRDEKIFKITESLVRRFEECILKNPAAWFWLHRRWKTTPMQEDEGFYG